MTFIHEGMEFITSVRPDHDSVGVYVDKKGNFQHVSRESSYGQMILRRLEQEPTPAVAMAETVFSLARAVVASGGALTLKIEEMSAMELLTLLAPNNIRFTYIGRRK